MDLFLVFLFSPFYRPEFTLLGDKLKPLEEEIKKLEDELAKG